MHGIRCLFSLLILGTLAAGSRGDDWPQWLGPKRDGVWRETGILDKFPKDGPKIRWRTPIEGGYAGPAVANGKVFVTDRVLAQGAKNPANPFTASAVDGKERALCLDETTGKIVWTHEYDCEYRISYPAGPRATPLVAGGKVYTLGAMGDLFCLEEASGHVVWSKNFPKDYKAKVPFWGFSSHPLLDGDRLICLVGGEGSVAVAFHKDTGKEIWRALSAKEIGYAPPTICEFGGQRELIIWHPESVNALDPENGKTLWSQPFTCRSAMSIPTPRQEGDRLFLTTFYNGPMMLQVDPSKAEPKVLWKGKSQSENPRLTDGLHAVMSTPFIKDGYIYGVCSYGELRCLKADTGERLWATFAATGGKEERWANAFIVAHDERFFLFSEKGDLIIARLTPKGYEELSRAHILKPTNGMADMSRKGRMVLWSHPAFANRCMYARNDKEIVCVSLAAEEAPAK